MPLASEPTAMCGRYSLFAAPGEIEERFDATFAFDFEPRYNAAPSQELPVVTGDDPETIQRMEWGLVPSWADEKSEHAYINARAETLAEKRSFADAYESRRCLVPADGMYEWVTENGGKQPYRVALPDDRLFAMPDTEPIPSERAEEVQRRARSTRTNTRVQGGICAQLHEALNGDPSDA